MSCLIPGLPGEFSRLQPRSAAPSASLLSRCASRAAPAMVSPKLSALQIFCSVFIQALKWTLPPPSCWFPCSWLFARDSLAQSPMNAVPCPENATCLLVPTCSNLCFVVVLKNNKLFCGTQLPIAFRIALHPFCLSGFLYCTQSIWCLSFACWGMEIIVNILQSVQDELVHPMQLPSGRCLHISPQTVITLGTCCCASQWVLCHCRIWDPALQAPWLLVMSWLHWALGWGLQVSSGTPVVDFAMWFSQGLSHYLLISTGVILLASVSTECVSIYVCHVPG